MRIKNLGSLLLILLFAITLLSACSGGGGSSSKSGAEEVSVCTKLKEWIDKFEEDASIIRLNPDASPGNFDLFGVGIDLREAGYRNTYESNYAYADILTFLDVAGSCLSADAYRYLSNYLESPFIKALREQEGN
jgi:hypothetical protein